MSYKLDISDAASTGFRINSGTGSDYPSIHLARGGTTQWQVYVEPSGNNLYFFDTNDNQAVIRADGSALNDDGWATQAVDYGEFMKKQNPSDDLKPFEVVGIKNGLVTKETNGSTLYMVTSSDAGIRGGNPLDDPRDNSSEWIVVAYTGQVPVLVNSEAKDGDYVIPSGLNDGKGVAIDPSQITPEQYKKVIGIVLSEFDQNVLANGDGKFESDVEDLFNRKGDYKVANVAVGVGNKVQIALNESGDAILSGDSKDNYQVVTSEGIVTKIGAFAKATTAKLQAGIGSFGQVETKVISPIANSDLIIDLTPEQSEASRLVIRGVNEAEVASIDAGGNADFAGSVETEKLVVNSDATISGTLYANNIESERLSEIEDLLRDVETNQQLLTEAGNWNSNTATESGTFTDLIASSIQTTDLYVTGQAALTSLFVTDNLTAGKIDSLDTPLQIQSLAATPLEIMAGKITVDTDGNTKFLGNVEIAGNLKINNIIVANNIDPMATESATLVEGEVNSNSTAGKAVLTANSEKVRINNNKVSLNTLIYITPITSTQNKVLYVKAKDEGYFEVGFSDTLDTDVEFNWWIIELQ